MARDATLSALRAGRTSDCFMLLSHLRGVARFVVAAKDGFMFSALRQR